MSSSFFSGFLLTLMLSVLPFFAILGFVLFVTKVISQKATKAFGGFVTQEAFPANSVRTMQTRMGKTVRFNNAVRIIEHSSRLFIKFPLVPALAIPLSEIAKVSSKKSLFGSKTLEIHFKNKALPPIIFVIKNAQVSQFKALVSKADGKAQELLQQPMRKHVPLQSSLASSGGDNLRKGIVALLILVVFIIIFRSLFLAL